MTLQEFWREFTQLPQTLGLPLKDKKAWFRQHMAAHLVGGPFWFGRYLLVCWLAFGRLLPWLCLLLAFLRTAERQESMREAKGPGEFPLWAMLWDTATSTAAAAVVAAVVSHYS